MIFRDREQAARLLVDPLSSRLHTQRADLSGAKPVVLGVPRGAVPMAQIVASGLDADLDIVLVHKFGMPSDPEFALGAVTEEGGIYLGMGGERLGLSEADIEDGAKIEIAHLQAKRRLFTPHRKPIDLRQRIAIIVDDGIATGATMTAAVRSVLEKGAQKVIVATPVASNEAVSLLRAEGAEVLSLSVPEEFFAVSQFYEDFAEVNDTDVVQALSGVLPEVLIRENGNQLRAYLNVPPQAQGIVVFAHGSGSGRRSSRNQFVARVLNEAGIATLLADLLSDDEASDRSRVFDIDFLSDRLVSLSHWVKDDPQLKSLPMGYFGASTGAAAALTASVRLLDSHSDWVQAIVSRGGRPDLAREPLDRVQAPTLLIVGGDDEPVTTLNRQVYEQLSCTKDFKVIPGATHLFEEPGALEEVAGFARDWFKSHLVKTRSRPSAQSIDAHPRP